MILFNSVLYYFGLPERMAWVISLRKVGLGGPGCRCDTIRYSLRQLFLHFFFSLRFGAMNLYCVPAHFIESVARKYESWTQQSFLIIGYVAT